MRQMIGFYDKEAARFDEAHVGVEPKVRKAKVDEFITIDPTKISWSRALKQELAKGRQYTFQTTSLFQSLYRPYSKQWFYFNRQFNEMVLQMPRIFPDPVSHNLIIAVKGNWSGDGQLALITDRVMSDQPDSGVQCFPLYVYEKADETADYELFDRAASTSTDTYTRRDGISDEGLELFQKAYPSKGEGGIITKEDLFYYIYGLLHSPDYRSRYADNLGKELPRIPAVQSFADFGAFAQAGRDLAHWHLQYETVAIYEGATLDTGKIPVTQLKPNDYRVTKMKFAKTKDATGKSVNDKTTVVYNERITIRNIPPEAYEYVVNGKPALEWVMERQAVTTDKDSGITNDANLWATETMNNAKYPLELFLRVITVSLETMKIVNGLPALTLEATN